jgi:hypothetical protein
MLAMAKGSQPHRSDTVDTSEQGDPRVAALLITGRRTVEFRRGAQADARSTATARYFASKAQNACMPGEIWPFSRLSVRPEYCV